MCVRWSAATGKASAPKRLARPKSERRGSSAGESQSRRRGSRQRPTPTRSIMYFRVQGAAVLSRARCRCWLRKLEREVVYKKQRAGRRRRRACDHACCACFVLAHAAPGPLALLCCDCACARCNKQYCQTKKYACLGGVHPPRRLLDTAAKAGHPSAFKPCVSIERVYGTRRP